MNSIEQAISFARQEYTRQGLGALYQKDFEEALLPALSQAAEIYRADTLRWSGDPKTDLLAALLWSQKLLNDYQRHQLPDEVFYHTIDDIGRWASEYWSYSGKIGLAESAWLTNHLTLRLFQLGRLQFCMEPADFSAPAFGLEPGEPLVSVHICRGGSLDPAACDASFAQARAFFRNTFRHMHFRILAAIRGCWTKRCCLWLEYTPIFHFFNSVFRSSGALRPTQPRDMCSVGTFSRMKLLLSCRRTAFRRYLKNGFLPGSNFMRQPA